MAVDNTLGLMSVGVGFNHMQEIDANQGGQNKERHDSANDHPHEKSAH